MVGWTRTDADRMRTYNKSSRLNNLFSILNLRLAKDDSKLLLLNPQQEAVLTEVDSRLLHLNRQQHAVLSEVDSQLLHLNRQWHTVLTEADNQVIHLVGHQQLHQHHEGLVSRDIETVLIITITVAIIILTLPDQVFAGVLF